MMRSDVPPSASSSAASPGRIAIRKTSRWNDGLAERLPRYAYMPFGGGPRYCLGQAFAQLEMALIVATIAQRRRLSATGPMPPPTPSITLRPADDMPLRIDARAPS